MLKKILLGIVALIVVFLVVAAMQPSDFTVTRSAVMAAPPASVFAQVNDFKNWRAWSPWEQLDPNLKRTYEGSDSGKGAVYRWAGDGAVGEGAMTIIDSVPEEQIRIELEFIKPFPGACDTLFTFEPEEETTKITWRMAGKNSFPAKAIGLVVNMDKMIGESFEKGLENMRQVVEKTP